MGLLPLRTYPPFIVVFTCILSTSPLHLLLLSNATTRRITAAAGTDVSQ